MKAGCLIACVILYKINVNILHSKQINNLNLLVLLLAKHVVGFIHCMFFYVFYNRLSWHCRLVELCFMDISLPSIY